MDLPLYNPLIPRVWNLKTIFDEIRFWGRKLSFLSCFHSISSLKWDFWDKQTVVFICGNSLMRSLSTMSLSPVLQIMLWNARVTHTHTHHSECVTQASPSICQFLCGCFVSHARNEWIYCAQPAVLPRARRARDVARGTDGDGEWEAVASVIHCLLTEEICGDSHFC